LRIALNSVDGGKNFQQKCVSEAGRFAIVVSYRLVKFEPGDFEK